MSADEKITPDAETNQQERDDTGENTTTLGSGSNVGQESQRGKQGTPNWRKNPANQRWLVANIWFWAIFSVIATLGIKMLINYFLPSR